MTTERNRSWSNGAEEPDETAEDNRTSANADASQQPESPSNGLKRAVEALSAVLNLETSSVRAGDFSALLRLQPQKRSAMRAIERWAVVAREALNEGQELRKAIGDLNEAVEQNMRVLKAATTAVQTVRSYALQAIEARSSDGLYSSDGAVQRPQRLSLNGVQVKL